MSTETTIAVIQDVADRYFPRECLTAIEAVIFNGKQQIRIDLFCPPEQRRRVTQLIEEIYDAQKISNGVWRWEGRDLDLLFYPRHDMSNAPERN